ncbi:MAG: glycosyltransferase family 4 protein [Saprospirales bacterium]|nr:MAG: glycosyltransferase family 4 protein [Saprospirales bacterium]
MENRSNPERFHIWVPNIFNSKGGVQTYSVFFLKALQEIFPESQYDVFLMHDSKIPCKHHFLPDTSFHCAGSWFPKARPIAFGAQALKHNFYKPADLILSTHINFSLVAQWLKYFKNTPYMAVAHGIEAWDIQKPRLCSALQGTDRILCVSQYTRSRLKDEQNLSSEKLGILPNTFDENRFRIASKPHRLLERYALSIDQPVILTVARLDPGEGYKGYDKILRSLPKIRRYIPNVHYMLVGKGDDTSRICNIIKQHNLEDCVTVTGLVPDEELCDYYNLCDVFAMPSKKEGFGIVFLEALACGKPVIAGNQDGSIDPLCNGNLGVLINPDNMNDLVESLIQVLNKTHSNSLIFNPDKLRNKTIENFGFETFKHGLSEQVKHLINSKFY